MNGITHKQAMKWIDRRQDGLLKGNQQTLLEEHLHSCDSCQSYSDQMELLASRLNHEFHARWEDDPGPSKNIVENVRAKAKSIPAAKRFFSGFQLAGSVTVLLILGIVINFFVSQLRDSAPVENGTEVVSSFPAAEDRLIAFSSTQNGNSEIYTMHADGSGLTNITNNPAYDGFPHWSPDGKQIAFESDRDGSRQIYLMNADGSNVIQLTLGGDANGFLGGNIQSPWSPDGRKLIFSQNTINDDKHKFYVLEVATKNTTPLTKETGKYYSPTWSPNGEHIAFILDESLENKPIRKLYVVDNQGDQLTDITKNLSKGDYVAYTDYYWSPDGRSITFIANQHSGFPSNIVYQAGLDGSLSQVIKTSYYGILDWWNGIAVRENTPPGKVDEWSWSIVRPDGSQSSLQTCQSNDHLHEASALKRSADGTLAFGMKCPPNGWALYGTNSEGTTIDQLLSSPLDSKYDSLFDMTWSPDDYFLAFMALDEEHYEITDLFVLNTKDPSAQPLKMENGSSPSWQPVINENLVKEKSPAKLTIDPQSCKPAEGDSVPGELSGYDVIQNTSLTDGDFTYDFWLYCDPTLKPEDQEHLSAIAGLGIYSSWRYTGPQVDGGYQFHYAFEPGEPFGETGTDGPLYGASAKQKDGIYLSEARIQETIQQGLPIQFNVVVDSSLGRNGAVLSFALEPTQDGVRIVDAHARQLNSASTPLLAFASNESGYSDIYTVHADGSGQTNLTNSSSYDGFPHWSPDGTQIVFESDRDGSNQLYLMDADGSNVTQLTQGGDANGFLGGNIQAPWSPDGSKLIFSQNTINDENHKFYVLDVATRNTIPLTREAGKFYSPTWSPDGKHIAFILDESEENKPRRTLFVVDNQGEHLTNLTEGLPDYEPVSSADYYWSPDGTSITFVTDLQKGTYKSTVYEASLDGSRVQVTQTPKQILDWWNGTALQNDLFQKVEEGSWSIVRADGSKSALTTCKSYDWSQTYYSIKRSSRGDLVYGINCSPTGWMLYGINQDGTIISELLSSRLDGKYESLSQLTWSADDRFLSFVAQDADDLILADLYILNVKDPSAQPLKMEKSASPSWQSVPARPIVKEDLTPQPTETVSAGNLIAFTAIGDNGNSDIFTVHPDGSGLANLTNNSDQEYSLAWSPDGTRLAFVNDRDGNGSILVMNADGGDLRTLAKDSGLYGRLLWSPDGTKIAYALQDPDGKTADIYLMDTNGQNQRRLTDRHPLPDYVGVGVDEWSPDSRYIYYMDYLAPGQSYIIQLDVESGKPTIMTGKMFDLPYYMTVNQDGSITYLVDCTENAMDFCLQAKSINQDGTGEETHETMQIQQVCSSKRGVSSFYFGAEWFFDRSKIVFAFACRDGVHLYIANADGSDLKPLTSQPVFYKDMGLNRSSFELLPDGRSIVFIAPLDVDQAKGLYALDVQDVLQNPDLVPTRLNVSASQLGGLAWQPMASTEPVTKESTPVPGSIRDVQALAGFEILVPTHLPKGYSFDRAAYDPQTREAILNYVSSVEDVNKMGTIVIREKPGEHPKGSGLPVIATPVPVAGTTGTYSDGAWIYDTAGITTPRWVQGQGYSLRWQKNGMSFTIDFIGGELTPPVGLEELTAIANSMESHSPPIQQTPTPEPGETSSYNDLVAFTSGPIGNQDIHTMRADGSQLTNLTINSANDYGSLWSPDGQKILFQSERTGNRDIFIMDADGSNVTQLTDNPGTDSFDAWSPDGTKIIYETAGKDINEDAQLFVMDADGNHKTVLTEPGSYLFLGWSPDSRKIVYLKQNTATDNPQDDLVVVMNTDGTDRHEWNFIVDRIKWVDDQHFIGDGWNGQVESPDWAWVLHRFSTEGDPPVEIASHSSRIVEILKDTHVVAGGSILAWYTSDGSPAPFASWNSSEVCRGTGDQFIPANWTSTAPDESKALIAIPCQSGKTWFYINPLDGSPIRKLTDFSVDGNEGGGPVWNWSPDGKYGIMTISGPDGGQGADFYLFDIDQMLKDPTVQPVRLTMDEAMKGGVVWQPAP